MAENSKIEWTNHTFNTWRGCTHVHAGCNSCYAETMSKRNPKTLGVWGDNGTRVVASESMWQQPLKWDRLAKEAGERHRVFCASLADAFEDWQGPMHDAQGGVVKCHVSGIPIDMQAVRRRLFALIDATPNLDWLLVTKRPENIRRMWPIEATGEKKSPFPGLMPPMAVHTRKFRQNVWLLTSVSDQATADAMIPHLLACRDLVPVLGLSAEPLLSGLDLSRWLRINWQCSGCQGYFGGKYQKICPDCGKSEYWCGSHIFNGRGFPPQDVFPIQAGIAIDWVIVGSESGHGRRPMEEAWAQSLADQCRDAGVKFFMKQMEIGGQVTGDIERFPKSLQVREHPNTKASVTA